ncbi:hypothetical protein CWB99_05500 [Pseudoalteromonas rubra]|uniref:Uncharacterized protein n=1 Tax=Pseudoalteromonas rubra TaxID=43658 RepID=A0A5S3WRH3_9GAMM|nr:hypothetical protein [Pseudoalteromonas rubra]TMP30789.1 hypothetical protein CWB99_05500 [Pseudoalteromonas rubra]TMP34157.1 hypothetical protein CWC00_08330 [Pseudoalteromonas rubra]
MLKVFTYILMGVFTWSSLALLLFYGNVSAYFDAQEASGDQVSASFNVSELQQAMTHEPELMTYDQQSSPVRLPQHELQSTYYTINKESQNARAFFKSGTTVPYELHNEAYLELDVKSIRQLDMGDSFEFLIPQTQEKVCAEIVEITRTEREKRLIGQISKQPDNHYQVHLTLTDEVIYGQIQLPSGNYVFESYEKYAWVAAKRNIHSTPARVKGQAARSHTSGVSVADNVAKPSNPKTAPPGL